MPLVSITVNDRAYTVSCGDGEEQHLQELAAHVDGKVKALLEQMGQVGDARLILMAALLITDEYFEAKNRVDQGANERDRLTAAQARTHETAHEGDVAAAVLEAAAKRIEDIAARLSES